MITGEAANQARSCAYRTYERLLMYFTLVVLFFIQKYYTTDSKQHIFGRKIAPTLVQPPTLDNVQDAVRQVR